MLQRLNHGVMSLVVVYGTPNTCREPTRRLEEPTNLSQTGGAIWQELKALKT